MKDLLETFKRWLVHPQSRRILYALGAITVVAISLTVVSVFALSGSDDSPKVDTNPAHVQTELVPTETGPAPTVEPTPPPESGAVLGGSYSDSGMRMIIDALGIDAPVITLGLDANAIPQVPYSGYQVGWYNFSSYPGGASNAVFSGHVTWYGAAVFYSLTQLAPGSTVKIATSDGRVFIYEVFRNVIVDPNDVSVMLPTGEPTLTMITCGGTWVPDSSNAFGGEYTGRTVVQARLISG